jgi:hypothetical protein
MSDKNAKLVWPTSGPQMSMAARLGRSLHWLGFGAAVILALMLISAIAAGKVHDYFNDTAFVFLWALGLAICGRLARYVLAAE